MTPDLVGLARSVAALIRESADKMEERWVRRHSDLELKIAQIPAGRDGERGEKGDSGQCGDRGERGEKGEQGERGQPGLSIKGDKGERGESGITGEPGSQGMRGERGEIGERGQQGVQGEKGIDGKDGRSIETAEVEAMIQRSIASETNRWALEFERRAADVFQRAIDKIPTPKDGKDGADAFSIDDLTITDDGHGKVTFIYARGDLRKTFEVQLPRFEDKGVFRDSGIYQKGDGVTSGGSLWIAQCDVPSGRPGMGDDWRLAIRRGQDGKNADRDVKPNGNGPVRLK